MCSTDGGSVPSFVAQAPAIDGDQAAQYLSLLAGAESVLKGPQPEAWSNRLDREHETLRGTLRWCLECGRIEEGLQAGGAVWPFWQNRGHIPEGREWLAALLSAPSGKRPTVGRAQALVGAGTLAFLQGDRDVARSSFQESLETFRSLGDTRGMADAFIGLARVALLQGDHVEMRRLSEESLSLARAVADRQREAIALHHVVESMRRQGEPADVIRPLYCESLALHRDVGDQRGVALELHNLANVERRAGNLREATALFTESLMKFRDMNSKRHMAYCFMDLGNVVAARGQSQLAARFLGVSDTLFEATGVTPDPDYRRDYEQSVAMVRRALGEAGFKAAYGEGRAMTLERAVESVLAV